MVALRKGVPHSVVGFSVNSRHLGAAVFRPGSSPELQPTRIRTRARDRTERARLGAWVEQTILRHNGELVAVVSPEEGHEAAETLHTIVRMVAERNQVPVIEVSRVDIAHAVGAAMPTTAAICTALVERHAEVASELKRKGVRSFLWPISENTRYWIMPLCAFGAVLASIQFVMKSIQT